MTRQEQRYINSLEYLELSAINGQFTQVEELLKKYGIKKATRETECKDLIDYINRR